jgi:uncharacterized membrane protein YhaH (DUF805 family)
MLTALFSFRGRLSRLAYLGWSCAAMALTAAIGVAFILLGAMSAHRFSASGRGPAALGTLMAATMTIAAGWSGLALAARRIRDAGYEPLVVIAIFLGLAALDSLVITRLTDIRFFRPFDNQTPFGGILCTTYFLLLTLWPSVSDPLIDGGRRAARAGAA